MLYVLAAHGWRQKMRIGGFRILEHPDRPRVYIYLVGKPSTRLRKSVVKRILEDAGIEESPN